MAFMPDGGCALSAYKYDVGPVSVAPSGITQGNDLRYGLFNQF